MQAKISVIMPVYNCERYLEAALQSVLEQNVPALEIIAVEDHSSDRSAEILRAAAARDARIVTLFHEQNRGVAAVRNAALSRVTGDFVAFCDADDIVPPGAYEALLGAIGERDVAIGSFDDAYDNGTRTHCQLGEDAKDSSFLALFSVCCLWTKLFRTSFLRENALTFDESMTIGEDVVFLANAATKNPSCALVPEETVYWHCQHRPEEHCSLTHIFKLETYRKHAECRTKLLEICSGIPECRDYVYLRFSWDLERHLMLLSDEHEREEAFELFRSHMTKYEFEKRPRFFKAMTGVPYAEFVTMSAEAYFARKAALTPRERVADEFDCGMIGMRWIWRYFKGWLRFKLKGSE